MFEIVNLGRYFFYIDDQNKKSLTSKNSETTYFKPEGVLFCTGLLSNFQGILFVAAKFC